jgi:cytochrome c553
MSHADRRPVEPDTTERDIDKPWRIWASAIVVGILGFGCLTGFVIMPVIQGWQAGIDPYTAICRALGVETGSPAFKQSVSRAAPIPVSQVAWTPQILQRLGAPDRARGAEVAANACASCQGEQGRSIDPAQFPNMAGQSPTAIYKQLHDYKSGARVNEIMQGIVAALDDAQMADVAAHFSTLEAPQWSPTWVRSAPPLADALARTGDSARGLPACESCHSPRAGGPIETPVLFAQSREYIAAQLQAYRSGARKNDLYSRMRTIAAKLSDEEITALAQYYAERR